MMLPSAVLRIPFQAAGIKVAVSYSYIPFQHRMSERKCVSVLVASILHCVKA
jgi:hypothetical protein